MVISLLDTVISPDSHVISPVTSQPSSKSTKAERHPLYAMGVLKSRCESLTRAFKTLPAFDEEHPLANTLLAFVTKTAETFDALKGGSKQWATFVNKAKNNKL